MSFGGNKCGGCQQTVNPPEEVQFEGKSWHKSCFISMDSGDGALSMGTGEGQGNKPKIRGPNDCPRCGSAVYAAEKMVGAGSSWHKRCFSCSMCRKKLDSTTVSDKNGEIYCKGCYGKNFGPKGFGFGQGAGALAYTK